MPIVKMLRKLLKKLFKEQLISLFPFYNSALVKGFRELLSKQYKITLSDLLITSFSNYYTCEVKFLANELNTLLVVSS